MEECLLELSSCIDITITYNLECVYSLNFHSSITLFLEISLKYHNSMSEQHKQSTWGKENKSKYIEVCQKTIPQPERWGWYSTMLPGPTSREVKTVFPRGTCTQCICKHHIHMYIFMASMWSSRLTQTLAALTTHLSRTEVC